MSSERLYKAPAAGRLLDLVDLLAAEREGLSLNEIARRLSVPLNTIYRIACEMESRGYLDRDREPGRYHLGARFFQIGQIVGSRLDLRKEACPILDQLRDSTGETAHLCILQRDWLVLLEQSETDHPIRIHVEAGSLLHPHASAFGKCLLAGLPADELDAYLARPLVRLTDHTLTDRAVLREVCHTVRQQGWAVDDEEYLTGVRCLGAPVCGPDGSVLAGIGIMGPVSRLDTSRLDAIRPAVVAAAGRLSAALGCPKAKEHQEITAWMD